MVLVSPHIVGLGSLCLLDFATCLTKEEGPPLYLIYAQKSRIVDLDCVIYDENSWAIEYEHRCDLVTVRDVLVVQPPKVSRAAEQNAPGNDVVPD